MRLMHLGRVFNMGHHPEFAWYELDLDVEEFTQVLGQDILQAPTVFNFFPSTHIPSGELGDHGLLGPVFKITDSITTIGIPNYIFQIQTEGFVPKEIFNKGHPGQYLDYSEFIPLENDPEALVERLDLLLCAGTTSREGKSILIDGINQMGEQTPGVKTQLAVYVLMSSPFSAVQQ